MAPSNIFRHRMWPDQTLELRGSNKRRQHAPHHDLSHQLHAIDWNSLRSCQRVRNGMHNRCWVGSRFHVSFSYIIIEPILQHSLSSRNKCLNMIRSSFGQDLRPRQTNLNPISRSRIQDTCNPFPSCFFIRQQESTGVFSYLII